MYNNVLNLLIKDCQFFRSLVCDETHHKSIFLGLTAVKKVLRHIFILDYITVFLYQWSYSILYMVLFVLVRAKFLMKGVCCTCFYKIHSMSELGKEDQSYSHVQYLMYTYVSKLQIKGCQLFKKIVIGYIPTWVLLSHLEEHLNPLPKCERYGRQVPLGRLNTCHYASEKFKQIE